MKLTPSILVPRSEDDFPIIDVEIGAQQSYELHATVASDILAFHFTSNSAVQTTFETPCTFLDKGFSSGPKPGPSSNLRIQLQNDNPVYFACIAHCHVGEVGVINAALDRPAASLVARAMNSTPDFSHVPSAPSAQGDGIYGAIVVPLPEDATPDLPSWQIALIVLGILAALGAAACGMYQVWLWVRRKDLAEWRAMRTLDDDRTMVDTAASHAARASAM